MTYLLRVEFESLEPVDDVDARAWAERLLKNYGLWPVGPAPTRMKLQKLYKHAPPRSLQFPLPRDVQEALEAPLPKDLQEALAAGDPLAEQWVEKRG